METDKFKEYLKALRKIKDTHNQHRFIKEDIENNRTFGKVSENTYPKTTFGK